MKDKISMEDAFFKCKYASIHNNSIISVKLVKEPKTKHLSAYEYIEIKYRWRLNEDNKIINCQQCFTDPELAVSFVENMHCFINKH